MKLKAKAGSPNTHKCAFCNYWVGDADVEYIGNNMYAYEQAAQGKCRANNDMRRRANDGGTCKKADIRV